MSQEFCPWNCAIDGRLPLNTRQRKLDWKEKFGTALENGRRVRRLISVPRTAGLPFTISRMTRSRSKQRESKQRRSRWMTCQRLATERQMTSSSTYLHGRSRAHSTRQSLSVQRVRMPRKPVDHVLAIEPRQHFRARLDSTVVAAPSRASIYRHNPLSYRLLSGKVGRDSLVFD
jgi:hypothetical protein